MGITYSGVIIYFKYMIQKIVNQYGNSKIMKTIVLLGKVFILLY